MICGRWDLGLRGLQELLIALVDQLRDLAADQVAGVGEDLRAFAVVLLDRCRNAVFLYKDPPSGTRSFQYIESMLPEPTHCVFVRFLFKLSCHCLESIPSKHLER